MRFRIIAIPVFSIVSSVGQSLPAKPGMDTAGRIQGLERDLKKSPGSMRTQATLVSAYLQRLRETGDRTYLDLASKLVDQMVEKGGGSFAALRFENEIGLQQHDFKGVAERARDMVQSAPSDQGTWGNLGDALMELGEYDEAGKAYGKMYALRPNLASYNRLGYFKFVTGDAQAGMAFMRQAVDAGGAVAENAAWCEAELGDMLFKTGKREEAAAAYQSAIELFPGLHRAFAGLGKVDSAKGHFTEAERHFLRAQSIVPMVEYAGALEDLYDKQGLKKKADEQRAMVDAIEQLGTLGRETTNRNLVLILANHGRRLDRALELIETELPQRGDVYTWDAYSWVLFKLGRIKDARTASLKAVHRSTPEPDFYRHAAEIADAAGDKAAAAEYRRRLEELH